MISHLPDVSERDREESLGDEETVHGARRSERDKVQDLLPAAEVRKGREL